jgi:hypothetical protein
VLPQELLELLPPELRGRLADGDDVASPGL